MTLCRHIFSQITMYVKTARCNQNLIFLSAEKNLYRLKKENSDQQMSWKSRNKYAQAEKNAILKYILLICSGGPQTELLIDLSAFV